MQRNWSSHKKIQKRADQINPKSYERSLEDDSSIRKSEHVIVVLQQQADNWGLYLAGSMIVKRRSEQVMIASAT